ncbi:putative deoxyribonuclease TATDN2 [Dermacentor andersoni]|uniref:putative deoxyribonuclease TATDN2 n=1 Tax=Dermacentor andersoni TaxID=34620 RepID=UPI002416B54A|nr:putative deoxyribonuclease TATDN2 [Dermacentor andersoni]
MTSPVVKRWPYTISSKVGLIDTHCHLDFLFRRTAHHSSYAQFRTRNSETFPTCYEGCVAVFCDPATFKKRHVWEGLLSEDGVWAAFGCHPHMARQYDEDIDDDLIAALEQPSVVALGEIGLDYSSKNNCDRALQQRVFRHQLKLGRNGRLPIVIHSRDSSMDTLRILKELWMDTFPKLCLGLTPLVGFPNAGPVAEVGRKIPLDRLLLETDAPYFLPKSVRVNLLISSYG